MLHFFTNNTSKNSGGAVSWNSGRYGCIFNTTFINNSVTNSGGGAVYWTTQYGKIINSSFINNYARFNGGAINWITQYGNTNGTIDKCKFIGNNVLKEEGGAIYWNKVTSCILNNSYFANNSDNELEAIYYYNSKVISNNCTYIDNSIGIYSGNVSVKNSKFRISNSIYAIYNEGTLFLDKNELNNAFIKDDGKIISKVNITLLNASYVLLNSLNTTLNATIVDDNYNKIVGDNFKFIICDGIEVNANYTSNGILIANYTFNDYGKYEISFNVENISNYTLQKSIIQIYYPNKVMSLEFNNISHAQNATFIFSLPDDARGNITFIFDDDNYTFILNDTFNTQFDFNISSLNAGNYQISAIYSGDDKYIPNEIDSVLKVDKLNITLSVFVEDIYVGEVAQIFIDLSVVGNVSLFVGDDEFNTNESIFMVPDLNIGLYNVSVKYNGSVNYNSQENKTSFNVNPKLVSVVSIDDVVLNIGESIVFTGKINNKTSDKLKFKVNGIETNSVSSVVAGNYVVEAIFEGNTTHYQNSTLKTFNVEKLNTMISVNQYLIVTAVDTSIGEKGLVFDAILIDSTSKQLANKRIVVSINGISYDVVCDSQGKISLKADFFEAKEYNYEFSFEGDDSYNPSKAFLKITVVKKSTSIKVSSKKYKRSLKNKIFKVTLKTTKSLDGKTYLKSGKKLILKLKNKKYVAKTNSKGVAKFKIKKFTKKGKFKAKITFGGDVTYKNSYKTVKITIK